MRFQDAALTILARSCAQAREDVSKDLFQMKVLLYGDGGASFALLSTTTSLY